MWFWFVHLPDPENPSGRWENVATHVGRRNRAISHAREEYGADEDGAIDVVVQDRDYFRVIVPDPWNDGEPVEIFASKSREKAVAWVKENLGGEDGRINITSEAEDFPSDPYRRKRWHPGKR